MLKTVLVLGALAVVFAVAWLALRRARKPAAVKTGLDDDGYLLNVRSTTGDFGTRPPPSGEMDSMNASTFPPPPTNQG